LHAVEQAWQPMQRVWSITLAQRRTGAAAGGACRGSTVTAG